MYDKNFLDAVEIVAFIIGVLNYEENLTQDDKDDILKYLDNQTKTILTRIETELEKQNAMLREILDRLPE